MSHSLLGADRRAHVRIVAASLAIAFVFVAALVAARVGEPDGPMLTANSPSVIKAEKSTSFSSRETAGAVR
jgi:hypothetical protein